jgi:hypothetical protein
VWGHLWRAVVLVVLVLAGALHAFLEGLGGHTLGWLLAPAALTAGGLVLAWLLWWRRPDRTPAMGGSLAAALLAGRSWLSPPRRARAPLRWRSTRSSSRTALS